MLTVHLTALDLSRTVLRPLPSVMQELTAAGKRLMTNVEADGIAGWKARTRGSLRPVMRPFLDLCRVPRWEPDFLTPVNSGTDLEAELDTVLATPVATLRAELVPRLAAGQLPARVSLLASGDPRALRALHAAATAFHAVAVAPYWVEMSAAVQADRASRASTMIDVGVEQTLRTLSPFLRWEASSLSYACAGGVDIDLEPGGRGVILVPSYLKDQPSFMVLEDEPVVIGFPIQRSRQELTSRQPLADLLGRTRAAVLAAVGNGVSTTDVARTVGVSVGSASQHTSVLRAAGLITTHRAGLAVVHALTPLGRSLLHRGLG
ncbi:ArsR/SmtB family transcription factor [Asanoa iriomotensis]|uniref:Transcriptional regulator n=1 Tax=Asanoa iriomotensis TaxID=234613 RepID=A0ABQ4CCI4_9ACTN|nr:winged helix-turn-helix domain-containing protein [Asanoa iriomotensis]GIF60486.1 transcriptional regulator [Asanoa iriomotensis]